MRNTDLCPAGLWCAAQHNTLVIEMERGHPGKQIQPGDGFWPQAARSPLHQGQFRASSAPAPCFALCLKLIQSSLASDFCFIIQPGAWQMRERWRTGKGRRACERPAPTKNKQFFIQAFQKAIQGMLQMALADLFLLLLLLIETLIPYIYFPPAC